jgi:hypothetical protein
VVDMGDDGEIADQVGRRVGHGADHTSFASEGEHGCKFVSFGAIVLDMAGGWTFVP